jgi:hypothetical protein
LSRSPTNFSIPLALTIQSDARRDPLDGARPSRLFDRAHATIRSISLTPSRVFGPTHATTHSMALAPSRLVDPAHAATHLMSHILFFLDSRVSIPAQPRNAFDAERNATAERTQITAAHDSTPPFEKSCITMTPSSNSGALAV